MKNLYVLKEENEGKVVTLEFFESFTGTKHYLLENDFFSWVKDNDESVELPSFNEITTLTELQNVLREYNLGWWTLTVTYVSPVEALELYFENYSTVRNNWLLDRIGFTKGDMVAYVRDYKRGDVYISDLHEFSKEYMKDYQGDEDSVLKLLSDATVVIDNVNHEGFTVA